MKKPFNKLSAIWTIVFVVASMYFLMCIVIFTFDISLSKSGRQHALLSLLSNKSSDHQFYKVNDKYGFSVDEGYSPSSFEAYEWNGIPFCLSCGWNQEVWRAASISNPYIQGDVLYSLDTTYWDNGTIPQGVHVTYNLAEEELGYVKSIEEISPDASDRRYRVSEEYVVENYSEISFSGMNDHDCEDAYLTGYVWFGVLLFWALLELIFRRKKPAPKLEQ